MKKMNKLILLITLIPNVAFANKDNIGASLIARPAISINEESIYKNEEIEIKKTNEETIVIFL